MKPTMLLLLLAFFITGTVHAEVPLLSSDELKNKAKHIVVGKVQAVYSTTEKSNNYENTRSVAEIAVLNVEKGTDITTGNTVYAHFWNKRWIGKGRPEPGSSGHNGVAKGDFVLAHLIRKNGTYHVLLPNGFAKLKAEEVKESPKNTTAKLQGTWSFVYYEEQGAVEQPGTKQFVISGNNLDFRAGGQTRVETTIEVDQARKHFTQKFKDGQVYRSIFTRVGDLLILCGNRDKGRPSEFAGGTDKGGEFFIVLKRE